MAPYGQYQSPYASSIGGFGQLGAAQQQALMGNTGWHADPRRRYQNMGGTGQWMGGPTTNARGNMQNQAFGGVLEGQNPAQGQEMSPEVQALLDSRAAMDETGGGDPIWRGFANAMLEAKVGDLNSRGRAQYDRAMDPEAWAAGDQLAMQNTARRQASSRQSYLDMIAGMGHNRPTTQAGAGATPQRTAPRKPFKSASGALGASL